MIDLKFEKILYDEYCYDISFANGDIETIDSFDNAILMSLMCERRADYSEINIPENRRGWWGNEFNTFEGFEFGCKLWLLYQTRLIQVVLNRSINYAREGLQWFIDDNHISKIEINGEIRHNSIILYIKLFKGGDLVFSRAYDSWQQTFID